MLAPAATPSPISPPLAKASLPAQHQYGTRIRSNSVIKPSARLRQSADNPAPPRRIKPNPVGKGKTPAPDNESPPPEYPPFPPPHVMLHSEDANNKVLLAIGRSFVSVDNKAMTIKDLAEMTMKYGLMCQNVSAAGQAITTYIRNHLQRCEVQQDHPLLLRHVLSGTPSDDDLIIALHSRAGGAHTPLNPGESRNTNFRRGTMVWYLSKAAGAPCPFARAGVRLCDYSENGKKGTEVNPGKERKRERDRLRRAEQCGQKRKRLLRACADKKTDSDSDTSEDEEPQCKRPLTLRLPPFQVLSELMSRSPSPAEVIDLSQDADSDSDDSMSEDSSSSSEDEEEDQEDDPVDDAWHHTPNSREPESHPPLDGPYPNMHAARSQSTEALDRTWRSLSIPHSSASSPPESEDEDFEMAIDDDVYSSGGHWDSDDVFADLDFSTETDTQWDSPGPMSPPSQFHDEEVIVKQEPRDVQGLLDSWEGFGNRVIDIVAQAAAGNLSHDEVKVKKEENLALDELWREITGPGYDEFVESPEDERALFIKEEEEDDPLLFRERYSSSPSMSPMTPFTPFSPSTSYFRYMPMVKCVESRRDSELSWADAELFSPHDVKPHDLDNAIYQEAEVKRERSLSKEPAVQAPPAEIAPVSPLGPPTEEGHTALEMPPPASTCGSETAASAPTSAMEPPTLPEASHSDRTCAATPVWHMQEMSGSSQTSDRDEIVVDTLTPCVPAVWATTFEGISVYQMVLGSSHIFRRIDTDFVNVSPVLQFLGLPPPDPDTLSSAVVVSRGDPLICGTWVDLAMARSLVRDEPLVKTFLSDELHEKFPQPLRDFHQCSQQGRSLKQFGPPFQSILDANNNADAKRETVHTFRMELPPRIRRWAVEDHLLSVHPPFALRAAAVVAVNSDDVITPETPLSPTEEEIFQTLCGASDWDASPPPASVVPCVETPCAVDVEGDVKGDADTGSEPAVTPPAAAEPAEPAVCREREKERERPLRRSKRVANAAFIRSRTRSTKRGSRTLS